MIIRYDPATDVLTMCFGGAPVSMRALEDGVVAQYNGPGQLVGLQIRDAAKRMVDLLGFRCVAREGLGPPVSQGQPPSTIVADHIVVDDRGIAWIDDTNVK